MNTLNFFRKGILALLVATTALVACSKDSDTDNLKPNTVTLKDVEKQITRAEYKNTGGEDYQLLLYLNNSDKERVELVLNKDKHMNGTSIELFKNDTTQGLSWAVYYYDSNGNQIIGAIGTPGASHFTQGTLTVSGTPGSGSVNILLKNGRVMGTDDKEYTLTLNYSGEMEEKQ